MENIRKKEDWKVETAEKMEILRKKEETYLLVYVLKGYDPDNRVEISVPYVQKFPVKILHNLIFPDGSQVYYLDRKRPSYVAPDATVSINLSYDKFVCKKTNMTRAQWRGRWGK